MQQSKNFANQSRIDKVIAIVRVPPFLRCINEFTNTENINVQMRILLVIFQVLFGNSAAIYFSFVSELPTTTTTTVLRPFFRHHPGEPVPENFWTLRCKGKLTETDTPTTRTRMGATPSGLSSAHFHHPPFYSPDALPAAQPTVSKH